MWLINYWHMTYVSKYTYQFQLIYMTDQQDVHNQSLVYTHLLTYLRNLFTSSVISQVEEFTDECVTQVELNTDDHIYYILDDYVIGH